MNSFGCDYWTGSRYCEAKPDSFFDEVTDEVLCAEHAGPLAWSDRDVNGVSLGLLLSGWIDLPYVLPARLQGGSQERAA